jgi:hypothetical protein
LVSGAAVTLERGAGAWGALDVGLDVADGELPPHDATVRAPDSMSPDATQGVPETLFREDELSQMSRAGDTAFSFRW